MSGSYYQCPMGWGAVIKIIVYGILNDYGVSDEIQKIFSLKKADVYFET